MGKSEQENPSVYPHGSWSCTGLQLSAEGEGKQEGLLLGLGAGWLPA